MIMDVETGFCKVHEQFRAILAKLEKAMDYGIHVADRTTREPLRKLH